VARRQLGKGRQEQDSRRYNSAAYLGQPRAFNAAWSDHLDNLRDGAAAISLRRSAA